MASPKATLSGEALKAMIQSSTGSSVVSIYDLCLNVFGKKRVFNCLHKGLPDPEIHSFITKVHELAEASWAEKGVSSEIGPYVAPHSQH
jgi:hypothetical protein